MSYSSEVLADSPTLYYRLNDGTTAIADSSGNAHSGTATAGVTLGVTGAILTDPSDNAVSLNGTTGDINIPDNIWSGVAPATVEFWAKPTASNPIGIFDSAPSQVGTLRNYNNGQVDWQSVLTVNLPVLSTSAWTHIVLVFKVVGGNRTILIYINGALYSTNNVGGGGGYAGTTNWKIGNINGGANGWYSGALDEFAVYSGIELSAARVLAHFGAAFPVTDVPATAKGVATLTVRKIPKGQVATGGPRPTDRTLPYIGHLYDNKGNFKRLLDPFLNRPALKQTLNGGFQPITLDMPLPIRNYADVTVADSPAAYFRAGDASGSLTDLMGGAALTAASIDKSASMSFGNPGAMPADPTTSLKNASAAPTSGYLFSPNSLWDISIPTAWSVEFLFFARAAADINSPMFRHRGITDGSGNPGDALVIFIDTNGHLEFYVHPFNTGLFFQSSTGYAPSLNAWHHLVLVNTNGVYTLYVDGVLRFTSASTYQPEFCQGFLACAHPGSMQELALYSASLTQAQVTSHNNGRAGAYRTAVVADTPLGYWRLGEPVLSMIAEPVASQARLTFKTPEYAQPPLVNDDKGVLVGSVGNIGTGAFSSSTRKPITGTKFALEAWIKPGSLTKDRAAAGGEAYIGGRCIIKVGDITTNNGVSLCHNGPDILFGAPSNVNTVANKLALGKHHVVWVHDSSASPTDYIYVDGSLVFTNNAASVVAPNAGLAIGNDPALTVAFTACFGGEIDEAAVWNFPLSAAQVSAHYKTGVDMTQGDLLALTEEGGDGLVLYKGIVEDIPDDYDLAPSFQIGLQPMVVELADAYFSQNYTVPIDIAQMVRDAVDATGHLFWTPVSVPLSGVLAQVDYTSSTSLTVLETAKKIGGPFFWWHVDAIGQVWFQQFDLTQPALYRAKRGVDHVARRYRSPISTLKNKVLCIGNIPPNQTVPIISLYSDLASQAQYGVRVLQPPLVYPNIIDQPTLDKVAATVGAELNRRITKVELDLPAFSLIQLGVDKGATMRYWEPNQNPLLEAAFGAGRYSPTYVVLDVEQDGPFQKVVLAEIPVSSDDLKYEGDRQQQRDFLNQLLHPDLSSTVPMSMSGGFFSAAIGSPITLPSGFTGFSLDAANGLSLYNGGILIARFGSGGASGMLQAYSGYQPVDATHKCILRYEYTTDVQSFSKVFLSFSLKAFRATQQTASGAGSTHNHTISTAHQHRVALWDGSVTQDETSFKNFSIYLDTHGYASQFFPDLGALNGLDWLTDSSGGVAGTSGNEGAHTHTLNAPSGLYDTGMAQGVHVYVDGTDRTTALGGPWGSGSAIDVSDLDISAYINTTGWHEILLSSTTLGVIIAQVSSKVYTKTV